MHARIRTRAPTRALACLFPHGRDAGAARFRTAGRARRHAGAAMTGRADARRVHAGDAGAARLTRNAARGFVALPFVGLKNNYAK